MLIDGQVVATGNSIGLWNSETLTMTFTDANQYADTATTNLTAGEYYGIGIDAGGISSQTVLNLKNQLSTIQSKLQAQDFTGMTKDDILGSLLYTTAISYYAEYDMMDQAQAKVMGVVIARVPSEAVFSVTTNVSYMFGAATNVRAAGLKMDVQRNLELTQATDGNNNYVIQYMLASGMNSSELENGVPEQLFSTPNNPAEGISAVKAIQIANNKGIPIYTIDQSNISTVLPQLQLSPDVISDIQDAVNAGEIVTIPKTNITYLNWTGIGYIIEDPVTGNAAYMISGDLAGGGFLVKILNYISDLLVPPAEASTGTQQDNVNLVKVYFEILHLLELLLTVLIIVGIACLGLYLMMYAFAVESLVAFLIIFIFGDILYFSMMLILIDYIDKLLESQNEKGYRDIIYV